MRRGLTGDTAGADFPRFARFLGGSFYRKYPIRRGFTAARAMLSIGVMPVRVLVVDDDDLILELAQDALIGFDVSVATSPDEALLLAEHTPFQIVCCDYQLPGMNGVTLLDRLAGTLPNMKSLLLTGSDLANAKSSRVAFAVVTKPFRPSELLEIVRALADDDLPRANELADRWGVRTTAAMSPPFVR